jgi:FixJ family two-component response regulator
MMERGAVTLLEKPYDHAALLKAVERGLTASHQQAEQQQAVQRLSQLSEEERCVLEGMLSGLPNKAIAATTGLSMRTLDRRRQTVLDKMGVRTAPELATMLGSIKDWRNIATHLPGMPADNLTEP